MCVYLSLTWAGKISKLDLFSLTSLSQGLLWSSWSFFITVSSQCPAPAYSHFTGLHFFFLIQPGYRCYLLDAAGLNEKIWRCDNFKLSNLTSWRLCYKRCEFCNIAVCSLTCEGGCRGGPDCSEHADKCAVRIPESLSVSFGSLL